MGQVVVHFVGTMARESTIDKLSAPKKNLRGFPHVFYIRKFQKSLFERHEAVVESTLASSSSLSSSSLS
jgi:hypothetical protein